MQKKLSKHFIYKWLEEDAYGEYILHHLKNKFSNQLLLNLWNFLNDGKRSQKGALVFGSKSTRYLDFISSALRYNFISGVVNTTDFLFYLEPQKKLLRLKKHFYTSLLYNTNSNLVLFTPKYKKVLNRFKRTFLRCKTNQLVWKENKIFLNATKYSWRKFRRSHRTRFIENSSTSNSLKQYFFTKVGKFRFPEAKSNFFALKTHGEKKIKGNYRRIFIRYFPRKFNIAFRRRSTFSFVNTPNLWRFFCTGILKNVNNNCFLKSLNTYPIVSKNSPLSNILINLKSYVLSFSWDSFAYKLKQKVRKFMQTSKAIRKSLLNAAYAKLKFKGTFQKKTLLVKKNEVNKLLSFRLLNYFNLITTPADLNKICYNTYYKSKVFQLPSPSALEFYVVPILLRSGFFENGYITNSLAKRNYFLLNGITVKQNEPIKVWDIVSVSKPVWWLVYARFINFFTTFISLSTGNSISILKSTNFVQNFIKIKTLFKKFDYRNKMSTKGTISKLIFLKNYIFFLPPAYMEVSYRLFALVIYRLANKPNDATVPFNYRGLKAILPTLSNKILN